MTLASRNSAQEPSGSSSKRSPGAEIPARHARLDDQPDDAPESTPCFRSLTASRGVSGVPCDNSTKGAMSVRGIRGATTVESKSPRGHSRRHASSSSARLSARTPSTAPTSPVPTSRPRPTSTQNFRPWWRATSSAGQHRADVGHEMDVPGSLRMCLRIMLLVNSEVPRTRSVTSTSEAPPPSAPT